MIKDKYYIKSLIAAIAFIIICQCELKAKTIAFGFFINKSNNTGIDYLSRVLPNSFASVLRNKTDIETIKPEKLNFLTAEDSIYQGKMIDDSELPKLSSQINADYFVYGSFEPVANNKIKLNIKIYKTYSSRVFSFNDEGGLESDLFKLVDRIGYRIAGITSYLMMFKTETVAKNSRIGIITNIEGIELNTLYYELMKNGFRISYFQGNELQTKLDSEQIDKLKTVSTTNAYYSIISDRYLISLPSGTWAGVEYHKKLLQQREVFNKYAFNFDKTWEDYLKRLKKFNESPFDYFMIIGFDKNKESAWIRCISLKENKLIIAQSYLTGSSIEDISKKILDAMTIEITEKL